MLLSRLPQEGEGTRVFEAANHLNLARDLLQDQPEQDEVARLNLSAGQKAKASGAYDRALQYLSFGRELLGEDAWKRCHEPMLALSEEAAEAAFLCGEAGRMQELTGEILAHARAPLERLMACQVQIQGLMGQNRPGEAIACALDLLRWLGVRLPEHPGKGRALLALVRIKLHASNRMMDRLLALPQMQDPGRIAAVQLMCSIAAAMFQCNPNLTVLALERRLDLLLRYGHNQWSGVVFAALSFMLAGVLGDLDRAHRVGRLALDLDDQHAAGAHRARVTYFYCCFASHCREHLARTLEPLREAYKIGLEQGDLEFSSFSLHVYCQHAFLLGLPLPDLTREMKAFSETIAGLRQAKQHVYNELFRQIALNLQGVSCAPWVLTGEAFDEQVGLPRFREQEDGSGIFGIFFHKMLLAFLFQSYQIASACADEARKALPAVRGVFIFTRFFAYDSLVQLAMVPSVSWMGKRRILARVRANQKKLRNRAAHAPENHAHLYYLVEAERHRAQGRLKPALECFDIALRLARKHGFVNDEALIAERAGGFLLAQGKHPRARIYLRQAHAAYERWGALAKVRDLEARFPALLRSENRRNPGLQTVTSTGQISP